MHGDKRHRCARALSLLATMLLAPAVSATGSHSVVLSASGPSGSAGLANPDVTTSGPYSVSVSVGGAGSQAKFIGSADDAPVTISLLAQADATGLPGAPTPFYSTVDGTLFAGAVSGFGGYFIGIHAADCTHHCFVMPPPPATVTVTASFDLSGETTILGTNSYIDITGYARMGFVESKLALPRFTTTTPPAAYPLSVTGLVRADGSGLPIVGVGGALQVHIYADAGEFAEADFSHTFKLTSIDLPAGYVLVNAAGQTVDTHTFLPQTPVPLPPAALLFGCGLVALIHRHRRTEVSA